MINKITICSPIVVIDEQTATFKPPMNNFNEILLSTCLRIIVLFFNFWYNCEYKSPPITTIDGCYYNSFPSLFIISLLCSIKEWTYLFNVTVGDLCPRISDNVFTSIPHSNALVAKVCRSEWNPLCGIFNFLCNKSKLRW